MKILHVEGIMGNLDDELEQKPLKEQEVLNALKNNTNYTVNITPESAEFGFNEWIKAQDGEAKGQNWQTWSAAMYLYAVKCVEDRKTPFFDAMRQM